MDKLLEVKKVRKIKTSQGNYAIDTITERRVKRFYKDSNGNLQVEYKKYPVNNTQYFFRRIMARRYYQEMLKKLETIKAFKEE